MLTSTKQKYIAICLWMTENPGLNNIAATNFECELTTIKRARSYGRSIGLFTNSTGETLRRKIGELTELLGSVEKQYRYMEKYNKHKIQKEPDPGRPDASGIAILARERRAIITTIAEMEGAYTKTLLTQMELSGQNNNGPIIIQIKKAENE